MAIHHSTNSGGTSGGTNSHGSGSGFSSSSSSGSGSNSEISGGSSFGSSGSGAISASKIFNNAGIIIIMLLFIGFAAAHIFRYRQTKTKHHLNIAGGAFFSPIGFILMIAGYRTFNAYLFISGFPVISVSSGILKIIPAFLLTKWSRSMVKVSAETSRNSSRIGVGCMVLFVIGTLLVIVAWILLFTGIVVSSLQLFRASYGLTMVTNIVLAIRTTLLLSKTPNNGTPEMSAKRRQLLIVIGMSASMFFSDLGVFFLSSYVIYAFMLLFLSFGLYPLHALTGFEKEPDPTTGVSIATPGVVYAQQPMSVPGHPGIAYNQPGVPYSQSGVPYNQPGIAYSQPGVVYNQPSVAYSQPGVAYSQPGVVYSQPGVMYSQPGVAYPPGAINHRGDESMASNINPPVSYAGVPVTGMPEPVVTPNVMENIPISSMPPPSTTPYPQ